MGILDKYTSKNLFAIMCSAGLDPALGTALLEVAYGPTGSKGKVNIIAEHLSRYRSGSRMDLSAARMLFVLVLQSEARTLALIESVYGAGTPVEALLVGGAATPGPAPTPPTAAAVAPPPPPLEAPHDAPEFATAQAAAFGDFAWDWGARAAFYFDDVVPRTEMPLADRNKIEAIITAHKAGVMPESWALVQLGLVLESHSITPAERTAWAASMFKNLLARPEEDELDEFGS